MAGAGFSWLLPFSPCLDFKALGHFWSLTPDLHQSELRIPLQGWGWLCVTLGPALPITSWTCEQLGMEKLYKMYSQLLPQFPSLWEFLALPLLCCQGWINATPISSETAGKCTFLSLITHDAEGFVEQGSACKRAESGNVKNTLERHCWEYNRNIKEPLSTAE